MKAMKQDQAFCSSTGWNVTYTYIYKTITLSFSLSHTQTHTHGQSRKQNISKLYELIQSERETEIKIEVIARSWRWALASPGIHMTLERNRVTRPSGV